jgi:hypothetical protein
MRLRIVHDKTGRIMAAAELYVGEFTVLPEPASPEHTAIELEVPSEHQKSDLAEICQRLRVEPSRKQLVPH